MNGAVFLSCSVCPPAVAADGRPEVCRLAASLPADVLAGRVRHHCRTDPPRCRFAILGPARRTA